MRVEVRLCCSRVAGNPGAKPGKTGENGQGSKKQKRGIGQGPIPRVI
jgi:hypothetical protein